MTLADTSAWIEFGRDRDAAVADRLESLIESDAVTTTEPVIMEVLAGARDADHERELASMLAGVPLLPVRDIEAWEGAARIYRACRGGGVTPRSQLDCLIAAVAIREDVPILHADRDFEEIAAHTSLRVVPV